MAIALIHVSDFHFKSDKFENQGLVLDAWLDDLRKQFATLDQSSVFLVFSGDIVQSADDPAVYDNLFSALDPKLTELGIPKERRIIVPGNHDVSTKELTRRSVEHEGVISQNLNESTFNDYVSKSDNELVQKFSLYKDFESKFSSFGVCSDVVNGRGWNLSENIAVYCLNTALCSSGGVKSKGGFSPDRRRLAVETRALHHWNSTCKSRYKILVMHHPLDWLTEWAEFEIKTTLRKDFHLCFSGHNHDQILFHSFANGTALVECSAPALFTKKGDELGYAIVIIDEEVGVTSIQYRQWTKRRMFVSGVNFSNTDDGKVIINETQKTEFSPISGTSSCFTDRYLTDRLEKALVTFSTQPVVWVKPVLAEKAETEKRPDEIDKIDVDGLIANPVSTIIKAQPQFGLTCLSHYMVRGAWRLATPRFWLYLDSKTLKPNSSSILQAMSAELKILGRKESDISCVVLDSWVDSEKDPQKVLQKVCEKFPRIPVICMETLEPTNFGVPVAPFKTNRVFDVCHLWSLPRSGIRQLISSYCEAVPIGDEDTVTSKIVGDLAALNLHRTPMNCLTLLKVFEAYFDESPVNRSEMINRILFLLFNVDAVPTYKSRPDLKDCEYVLGYFCDAMFRANNFEFSRDQFIKSLTTCCKERLIELEVQMVFDVLLKNNILVGRGYYFSFKFSYWLYYFAAQRMHHDAAFADFIYTDQRYVQYPEVIEFYTGIDRSREDALRILIRDVSTICQNVREKTGLPANLNPYQFAQWTSTPSGLEKMRLEISDGVKESNLPLAIKDKYADKHYDPSRPYDQNIRQVLSEYSFLYLVGIARASARALRNSDYVAPEVKRELLSQIMDCWELASKVLLVILPVLAERGIAQFEGTNFVLAGDFGETVPEKALRILTCIPSNIVGWFAEDLFSQKMGPLLLDRFSRETSDLVKHELALLIATQRPRGWKTHLTSYVTSVTKNSFFLLDLYNSLRGEYSYSFSNKSVLDDIEYLIRMIATKHATGTKEPGPKLIHQMKSKLVGNIVPERRVE